MDPISATTTIDAPRERVFEFLLDLANRPAIADHFQQDFRLERLDSAGVGAAARFRLRDRGWMETEIAALAFPHRIVERGRGGRTDRVPSRTVWELVPGPGAAGCEVTVSFWTEPTHPADRLRERLGSGRRLRRALARTLDRLRDVIENERRVERVAVAGADRLAAYQ